MTKYFQNLTSTWLCQASWFAIAFFPGWSQAQTCRVNSAFTALDQRYSAVNDGAEVKDHVTGLIWQRCSVGQRWTGKTCQGATKAYPWNDAQALASSIGTTLNVANSPPLTASASGADSAPVLWRLPKHKELYSLVEQACHDPAINTAWFPATRALFYWSASTFSEDTSLAWGVDFSDGRGSYDDKAAFYSLRLVRSDR